MPRLSAPNKKKRILFTLPLIALFCISLWFMRTSYVLIQENYSEVHAARPGVWDLRDTISSGNIFRITGDMTYIPGLLLTPDEFAEHEREIRIGDPNEARAATSRARILLPEGTYVIADSSVDYAMRLYINGELRQETGVPAETAEDFHPSYAYIYLETRPENGMVEIVMQGSNFVHRDNGGHSFYIGTPAAMKRMVDVSHGLASLTMGLFLCMFIIHLALYFIFRGYRANLYFSLFCLTWFFRTGLTGVKILWGWFPDASWPLFFRLEYLSQPLACVCILLLLLEIFPRLLPHRFIQGLTSLTGIYILLCIFLPTLPLSWALLGYEAVFVLGILFFIICLCRWLPGKIRKHQLNEEQWITLAGLGVFFPVTIYDVLYFNNMIPLPIIRSMSDAALLIFAFFQIFAVFYGTMRQVTMAEDRERRAMAEKEMLEEMSQLKNEFYTNMSHEMKTPLTVISVNAQFAAQNIEAGVIDGETVTDLTAISAEARRLAQMVTSLVGLGRLQGNETGYSLLAPDVLVKETVRIYHSLFVRQDNILTAETEPGLPSVAGNADQIVQVLINLLSNANRHTRGGAVTVRAELSGNNVQICVTDNGEGIDPALLPHVFERFRRGDESGTGLGLSICKTIIEEHGGEISIDSQKGKGTRVWFTLPVKEEWKHE